MLTAGFCLTVQDAVVKWMTGDYPVGEIMAIRGFFALLFALPLLWLHGGIPALRLGHPGTHLIRVLCVIGTTVTFVTAMRYLPLATAITITFAGPLIITALAPRFLGEQVGWRRWAAVGVGFLGILIIFRPGIAGMEWAMLLPLSTAIIGAIRDLITRKLAVRDNPAGMLFYALLGVTIAGGVTLPMGWVMPTLTDMALFTFTGFMIGTAQFLLILAFRYAEAAIVAPFKYASVLWGGALGYVFWGDVPDIWVLFGALLIITSGLYILRRETRLKREHPVNEPIG